MEYMKEPTVEELARELEECFDAADGVDGKVDAPSPTTTAPTGGRFPLAERGLDHRTVEELISALERICSRRPGTTLTPYAMVRKEFCALNIELSRRGSIPPAFRPTRKSPPISSVKGPEARRWAMTLSNDRLILDLHWLHATGFRQELNDEKYRDLLTVNEFDFAGAEMFAGEAWKTEVRVAKILALTEYHQYQLGVLMTDATRNQVKALKLEMIHVSKRMRDVAQRGGGRQIAHADDLAKLWLADQLCGRLSQRQIAKVHQWLTRRPEPLTKATISPKLKKMRSWLAMAAS